MMKEEQNQKLTVKRIILYLVIAFALTYVLELVFILPAAKDDKTTGSVFYTLLAAFAMMMPAIAVALTRWITKEGFQDHHLTFSWKSGVRKYYVLAWFLPPLLTLVGTALYFLIFTGQFDWNMTYYMNTITKTGAVVNLEDLRTTILSQLITAVILGPVMNCITCFGEEWGWRGYLLPKLMKMMHPITAILLSSVIWSLWHVPYILAGLNYGMDYEGYPYLGILVMTLFCLVAGIFFSYITIRTNSCIPAIIGHGAVNAIAAVGVYFTVDGGKLLFGPPITGLVSMIPFAITSVILIVLLARDKTCVNVSTCDTMIEASSDGENTVG